MNRPFRATRLWLRISIVFVASAAVIAGYQNCSPSFNFNKQLSSLFANCTTLRASLVMQSYSSQNACEDISHYACDEQIVGGTAPTAAQQQCASVAGLGNVCLTVDATVLSNPSATTSFHCVNTQVAGAGGFLLQAWAPTLDQALASVLDKCRTRSL